jgi:hypothetical protein
MEQQLDPEVVRVLCEVIGIRAVDGDQTQTRRNRLRRCSLQPLVQELGAFSQQRGEEMLLVLEVRVERTDADAGGLGDVLHGREPEAAADENTPRREQDLLPADDAITHPYSSNDHARTLLPNAVLNRCSVTPS